MPVRFRCDTCNGKLSIATRKIGMPVECPRCNESMLVPNASQIGEELTELLLSVGGARREAIGTTAPILRPGRSLEEMPLFERDDIDEMLEPLGKVPAPLPLPEPIPAPAAIDSIDAIVLSRTRATVFAVIVVVMLGLSFGLGYVARGFNSSNLETIGR